MSPFTYMCNLSATTIMPINVDDMTISYIGQSLAQEGYQLTEHM